MKQERDVSPARRHPIDAHVGRKIRMARIRINVTQAQLADGLGISFQQVQKYESGENRISASRLFETGRLLGVPPAYFFEDVAVKVKKQRPGSVFNDQTLCLMKYAERLSPEVRNSVTRLLQSISEYSDEK